MAALRLAPVLVLEGKPNLVSPSLFPPHPISGAAGVLLEVLVLATCSGGGSLFTGESHLS